MKKRKKSKIIVALLVMCMLVSLFSMPETSYASHVYRKADDKETQWHNDGKNEEKGQKEDFISDDSPMFHYVDKENFEKEQHSFRIEDEERLNTYVFGNEDGTKTVYYMYENVKFRDENGIIKEKDISLVEKEQGYGIVQNEVDLFLPNNPREGIIISYSEYEIKIIPQGGREQVTIKKDGEAVVYENYFDENSSLKYTPLLSGIKEDIILTEYAENVAYDFIIETNGLYMYNDSVGYYLADENNTTSIFYLGDVEVYDTVGKPCTGEMRVDILEAGQKYILTLSVEDEFLSDPETIYPVTIDPTITISDTLTGANSIIDVPIFEGKSTKNYYNYKYNTVGTTTASYGKGRTVVNIPGLVNSTEYQNISADQIENIKLYVKDSSGTGSQTIYLYPLRNSGWTETSVTWENVGSYYPKYSTATLSSGKVSAFDITSVVKAWKNNQYTPNAGFILINSTETNNKSFYSSEYSTTSYRPYVVMTYTAGINIEEDNVNVVRGSTIKLNALVAPTDSAIVWKSSNTSIATVSSTGVVTGVATGKVTITATMSDGGYQDTCLVEVKPSTYIRITEDTTYSGTISNGRYFWYKFTPTETGYYTIQTSGSLDTYGEIYLGNSVIAYDDDDGYGLNFYMSCRLSANTTYYLLVRGYSNSSTGDFDINVKLGWPEVSKPTIKSRSDWGARSVVTERLVDRTREPQRIIYHHSAEKFSSTDEEEIIAEIQRIQNAHMDDRNKCDIAYHFIIDPAGNIWQGAAIDDYQRGHCEGYYDDIGVLILGDFESRWVNGFNPNVLNQEQKDAMETIGKWLCYEYELPVVIENGPIATHGMLGDTACPGNNCAEWIEDELSKLILSWRL